MIQILIFQPLYNLLAIFLNLFHGELGWAVLVLAALIRFALWPWHYQTMENQKKITKLQPKIKEIQNKYKQDPMKANQETMKIFQEEKVSLGGSFLFIFIQLFILIILLIFFKQAINTDWSSFLYPFIALTTEIKYIFLGLIDLKMPSFILALISAFLNFLLVFTQPSTGQNRTMMFALPFLILFFYHQIPAFLFMYWIGFGLANILQEIIMKFYKKEEIILKTNK